MAKKHRSGKKRRPAKKRPPRQRHNGPGVAVPSSILKRLQQQWPWHEVLVNANWNTTGGLTQLLVSRRGPQTGDVVVGVFLVDLGCLGVKNGFMSLVDNREYNYIVDGLNETQPMTTCDPNLAAKIVLTSLEFADSLGFTPHPDAVSAFPVLVGANASACDEPVPVGDGKGKPLYISGPDDNVQRIMTTLENAVGKDGFEFTVGEAPDGMMLPDDLGFDGDLDES